MRRVIMAAVSLLDSASTMSPMYEDAVVVSSLIRKLHSLLVITIHF
jgi:hypothetical protein